MLDVMLDVPLQSCPFFFSRSKAVSFPTQNMLRFYKTPSLVSLESRVDPLLPRQTKGPVSMSVSKMARTLLPVNHPLVICEATRQNESS